MIKKLITLFLCVFTFSIVISCNKQEPIVHEMQITTDSEEALFLIKEGRKLFEENTLNFVEYFEKAIKLDSTCSIAYYYLANGQTSNEKFYHYLNKAKEFLDNSSEGEKLFINAAVAEYIDRDNTSAEKSLLKLKTMFPKDSRIYNSLGYHYFRQSNFSSALEYCQKSVDLDSNFADPYNMVSYCYSYLGNYNKAEKALKKYVELLPNGANPHDSYGEILMKQGKFDESIEEYRKALSIDPNFVLSYVGLGTNLIFKGKADEGRKQFQKLYDIASNDGQRRLALKEIANSFIHENELKEAIQELQKSYTIAKKNNNLIDMSRDINRIADIYLEMGKFDESREKYLKSLELIKKSKNISDEQKIRAKRGFLYDEVCMALKQNDLVIAKNKTEQYRIQVEIENDPAVIRAYHKLLGLIALYEKNYNDALDEFLQVNQRNPRNLCLIAEIYEGLGNTEKAKEFWGKAANFNEISTNYAFIRNKAIKKLVELN